jgi:hypothetical protein
MGCSLTPYSSPPLVCWLRGCPTLPPWLVAAVLPWSSGLHSLLSTPSRTRAYPSAACDHAGMLWLEKNPAKRSAVAFGFVCVMAWVALGTTWLSACGSHARTLS